jgi:hypothetical protein
MHTHSTATIRNGLRLARWTISDLWIAAVAIGGAFSHHDIDQIASGQRQATPTEHDILAAAMNEHFLDHGYDHPVAYWHDLPTPQRPPVPPDGLRDR